MKKRRKTVARLCVEDGATDKAIQVAKRRTFYLLDNWRLMDYSMERLLVSCYFQGLRDMAETIINHPDCVGATLETDSVLLDFQI